MPEFPKSKVLRSQRTVDDIRGAAETCEIPGCSRQYIEVHHIKSKGAGGSDVRCNLVGLCREHHADAQAYRIPQIDLFRITARRDGMTLSQVYAAVGLDPPPDMEIWKADVHVFVQLHKDEEEAGWKIAEHAAYMMGKYGRGAATRLAREAGVSASYIRSLAVTARTFPFRNPSLSMGHHRIAAQTESPKAWLKRAAEKKWSVREMEDAIKDRNADEEYQAQVERLEHAVTRFNETWGTSRNVQAILVWKKVASA